MIALRNLLRNRVRSALTLLGVAVGIALYVCMAVITGDVRRQTRDVLEGYDTDVAVMARGASSPITSAISRADFQAIQDLLGPEDVSPVVLGSLHEKWNPYALVIGTTRRGAAAFRLVEGEHLSGKPGEVLAGRLLAENLKVAPGSALTLSGERFTVAGVYSLGSRIADGGVILETEGAQRLLRRENYLSLALVRVRNKGDVPSVIEAINGRLPGLKATSGGDFVGNIRFFRSIEAFARAISSVSLLATCILLANTLLLSVSERTREIGILMAIGWKPAMLLRMLLWESLLLCTGGAVVGNGLALLILGQLRRSEAIGFTWVPMTTSWSIFEVSVALSALIALASVAYPAFVALRLSPAEALRHE